MVLSASFNPFDLGDEGLGPVVPTDDCLVATVSFLTIGEVLVGDDGLAGEVILLRETVGFVLAGLEGALVDVGTVFSDVLADPLVIGLAEAGLADTLLGGVAGLVARGFTELVIGFGLDTGVLEADGEGLVAVDLVEPRLVLEVGVPGLADDGDLVAPTDGLLAAGDLTADAAGTDLAAVNVEVIDFGVVTVLVVDGEVLDKVGLDLPPAPAVGLAGDVDSLVVVTADLGVPTAVLAVDGDDLTAVLTGVGDFVDVCVNGFPIVFGTAPLPDCCVDVLVSVRLDLDFKVTADEALLPVDVLDFIWLDDFVGDTLTVGTASVLSTVAISITVSCFSCSPSPRISSDLLSSVELTAATTAPEATGTKYLC